MIALLVATSLLLSQTPTQRHFVPTAEQEVLYQQPDTWHLEPFFEKINAQGPESKNPVRISWWGDSALVGDGYTGEVRRVLQRHLGDGGPGFLLFSPPFEGYRSARVRMKRHHWEAKSVLHGGLKSGRFGLAGVVNSSYGGAGSTFELDATANRLFVFYRGGPKAGGLQLYLNREKVLTTTLDARSDTWEDRVWTPELGKDFTWARMRAAGGGRTEVYGVAIERAGPGIVLDTLGIVGIRARRWRKANGEHLAAQVASRETDLIVLNFGGNERVDRDLSIEKHSREIRETLDRFRAGSPASSCLIVGPLAHGHEGSQRLDPRLKTVGDAQRKVAGEAGCAYLDTIILMGGENAVRTFRSKGWMGADLAHLNGKGHRELGRRIADWLWRRYGLWDDASDEDCANDGDYGPELQDESSP
jgi:lysophospholipase L1-like esterase